MVVAHASDRQGHTRVNKPSSLVREKAFLHIESCLGQLPSMPSCTAGGTQHLPWQWAVHAGKWVQCQRALDSNRRGTGAVVHELDMLCPVDASVGRCLLSSVRLISSQSKQTINKLCNSSSTNVNLRVVVARYCSDCQGPRHPRWNVDKQRNSPLLQIFTVTPSVARLFQKSNMLPPHG